MALTKKQQAAIRRENGRKSKGPISDAGKTISRRNALKHGLRAEVLALPHEDTHAIQARVDSWNDYYKPESPAAQHLVNQCIRATILADRVDRHQTAVLDLQAREAEQHWDDDRADHIAALAELFPRDPANAARMLHRTAHGCRWLIARWMRLAKVLNDTGYWAGPDLDEVLNLSGWSADYARLKENPDAFLLRLYSTTCWPEPAAGLDFLLVPQYIPPSMLNDFHREGASLPDAATSLAALRGCVRATVAALRDRAAHLESTYDAPARAAAADRSLIPDDGASARLLLRYHAEARTSFHRAYSELVKALSRDAASSADFEAAEPVETAPPAPAPGPVEAAPPNEANIAAKSSEATTSVGSDGPSSGRSAVPGPVGQAVKPSAGVSVAESGADRPVFPLVA